MKIDSYCLNEQIDEYRQNYKIDWYEFCSLYELTGWLKTLDEFTELIDTIFQKIRSFEDWLIGETFLQFVFPLDSDFTEYDIEFEKLFYFVEENIDNDWDTLLRLNECDIMNNRMLADMFMSFVSFTIIEFINLLDQ